MGKGGADNNERPELLCGEDSVRPEKLGSTPVLIDDVLVRVSRSSGPGGQHANSSDTRVEATLEIDTATDLPEAVLQRLHSAFGKRVTAVAQDARGQARNRGLALDRLAEKITMALRVEKPRKPSKPSRSAKEQRLENKRRQSQKKQSRQESNWD